MLDRRQFLTGAAAGLIAGGLTDGAVATAAAVSARARAPRPGLALRGVTYDTGTLTLGATTRRVWSAEQTAHDIAAIAGPLSCSTVTVFGSDLDRLYGTARAALRRGLHVSIQPRLYDHSPSAVLAHLSEAAQRAHHLRREHPGAVTLIAGCEHMLFTPGIVPGRTFLQRIANLSSGKVDFAAAERRLNRFLGRAAATCRRQFDGPLTYAAAEFELVDWSRFDLIGLDYYAYHRDRNGHSRTLRPFRRWGKPIVICEFGCCTYRGAPRRGGDGYDIVDYSTDPPVLTGDHVRSERTQARYIGHMLDVFESERLHSACLYTFIEPDSPYLPDPRHDLDTAAFAIVKVIRRRPYDPRSPYRWQRKLAFGAVAAHNAARRTDPAASAADPGS
jgi:hypothetical protein